MNKDSSLPFMVIKSIFPVISFHEWINNDMVKKKCDGKSCEPTSGCVALLLQVLRGHA